MRLNHCEAGGERVEAGVAAAPGAQGLAPRREACRAARAAGRRNPWAEGTMRSWHDVREAAFQAELAGAVEDEEPAAAADQPAPEPPERRCRRVRGLAGELSWSRAVLLWHEFREAVTGDFMIEEFVDHCRRRGHGGVTASTSAVRNLTKSLVVVRRGAGRRRAIFRLPEARL